MRPNAKIWWNSGLVIGVATRETKVLESAMGEVRSVGASLRGRHRGDAYSIGSSKRSRMEVVARTVFVNYHAIVSQKGKENIELLEECN